MKDVELDPDYVNKREQLKEVVASIIRPKIVQGKFLNGKEFVLFFEQVSLLFVNFPGFSLTTFGELMTLINLFSLMVNWC